MQVPSSPPSSASGVNPPDPPRPEYLMMAAALMQLDRQRTEGITRRLPKGIKSENIEDLRNEPETKVPTHDVDRTLKGDRTIKDQSRLPQGYPRGR
jgi:hypothetical protein